MGRFSIFDVKFEAILLVLLCVGLYFAGKLIPQETIQTFVQSAGPLGPFVFIASFIPTVVIAPVNGIPFMIAGFYLFGKETLLYILTASIIGYSINFLIAKRWGKPVVIRLGGEKTLHKIQSMESRYTVFTLVLMRLFLSSVGDFISYGFGLTPIRFPIYFVISTVASVPSFVLRYFLISESDGVEKYLAVSLVVSGAAAGIYLLLKFINNKIFKKKTL